MTEPATIKEFDAALLELHNSLAMWKRRNVEYDDMGRPAGWPMIEEICEATSAMGHMINAIERFKLPIAEFREDTGKRVIIEDYMKSFRILTQLMQQHQETIGELATEPRWRKSK